MLFGEAPDPNGRFRQRRAQARRRRRRRRAALVGIPLVGLAVIAGGAQLFTSNQGTQTRVAARKPTATAEVELEETFGE